MRKILILSLIANFLYSGEKRDLVSKLESSFKRVAIKRVTIADLLDENPIVKMYLSLSKIKTKSDDKKLSWLLYGLPDELKDEVLGHYFDNFFKDGNTTDQELISKIQPFISLNSDNSAGYKMGKEAFNNYVVDRYCKDFDFFACISRRLFLIKLFSTDYYLEIQKSACTEKLKRFLSSNSQVTDSNFGIIKQGFFHYKKDSLLDLYRVVIKTAELIPYEFKDDFRSTIIQMHEWHFLGDVELWLNLYELSLKNEVFKKAVMINGYFDNDINFQRFKTEFEKLNEYKKISWIKIVSDIDVDIALSLCSDAQTDLKALLRIKKVSSYMFNFLFNSVVESCTRKELVELLKSFENVSEDLKQDLFFALSERVSHDGLKVSKNVEAFVNALWPGITQQKKAELGQKVSEKLLSLDEKNNGFFRVAEVLLRYASDKVKKDYIQKLLEKPDKYHRISRYIIEETVRYGLARRLGLN